MGNNNSKDKVSLTRDDEEQIAITCYNRASLSTVTKSDDMLSTIKAKSGDKNLGGERKIEGIVEQTVSTTGKEPGIRAKRKSV